MTSANGRDSEHPIDPLFLQRWSPRAFSGEAISEAELLTILEAGRWAASSYNSQPWRFVWARRGTPQWDTLFGLLVEFNQSWAKDAAALFVVVSNSLRRPSGADKDVPSHSHSFDAGAASANVALQATMLGWHVHGMVGFDMERAFAELNVPPGYRVEAAYAVGRLGDKSRLPEALQARETPSTRQALDELVFEGSFPALSRRSAGLGQEGQGSALDPPRGSRPLDPTDLVWG